MIHPASEPQPGFEDSWYVRTVSRPGEWASLTADISVETCVVGGGLAGINTALSLAETGRSVCLLEARRFGHGASGRNGGFVSAGYARAREGIIARAGRQAADALDGVAKGAVETLRRRIEVHEIPCGPITNGMLLPTWFEDADALRRAADQSETLEFWDRSRLAANLATDRYRAALFDPSAFQLHPLNLTRGLASAAEHAGALMHEMSPVRSIARNPNGSFTVTTDRATVRAERIVLAMSGYREALNGRGANVGRASILPIATFVMVTEPLGDRLTGTIRLPFGIADSRFSCDYYRPLPDTGGRLLWGGRISVFRPGAKRIATFMARDMARVYPDLRGARIDFAWMGLMGYGFHKMPLVRPLAPNLWINTGFGGHGLNTTLAAGELVASAIAEGDDRYRLFEAFGPVPLGGPIGLLGAQTTYWANVLKDEFRITFS